jgi:hypothetical protein
MSTNECCQYLIIAINLKLYSKNKRTDEETKDLIELKQIRTMRNSLSMVIEKGGGNGTIKNPTLLSHLMNVVPKKQCRSKMLSMRLIAMLISLNISFCLLSMPMSLLQIVYNFKDFKPHEVQFYEFLHSTSEFLQYLNHSSNFILYSLSGRTFRNESKKYFRDLIQMIKKIKT